MILVHNLVIQAEADHVLINKLQREVESAMESVRGMASVRAQGASGPLECNACQKNSEGAPVAQTPLYSS
jgi:hypothetical protein